MGIEFRRPRAQDRDGWIDLIDRTGATDIKLHPDFVFGELGESDPLIYIDTEPGASTPRALAVLAAKTVHLARRPPLRNLTALRGRRVVSDQILGSERGGVAARFLSRAAELLESGAEECLFFEDLEVESELWTEAERFGREGRAHLFHHSPAQKHWWIRFPDPPDHYFQKFSSKARNTLRRKVKKLRHELVRCTRREDLGPFLAKARQISENSWQSKRLGLRIHNSDRERRMLAFFADRGALRAYLLEHKGQPLAFLIGIQWRGRFLLEETGFDASHAKSSPGVVLLYRVIDDLLADDCPEWFDFGAGDADYKQHFGNHATASGSVLLVSRSLRPSFVYRIGQAGNFADQQARAVLRRTGLYERARQVYRRRPLA